MHHRALSLAILLATACGQSPAPVPIDPEPPPSAPITVEVPEDPPAPPPPPVVEAPVEEPPAAEPEPPPRRALGQTCTQSSQCRAGLLCCGSCGANIPSCHRRVCTRGMGGGCPRYPQTPPTRGPSDDPATSL